MATRAPAVRGRVAQTMLQCLLRQPAEMARKLLELVPPASRAAIEHASPMGWVSLEHDKHMHMAMTRVLGIDGHRALVKASIDLQSSNPIMAAFVHAAVRMFRLDPARFASYATQLWPMVFRDLATIRAAPMPGNRVCIELTDVAPEMAALPAYVITNEGVFSGMIQLTGVHGRVRSECSQAGTRQTYVLDWIV